MNTLEGFDAETIIQLVEAERQKEKLNIDWDYIKNNLS